MKKRTKQLLTSLLASVLITALCTSCFFDAPSKGNNPIVGGNDAPVNGTVNVTDSIQELSGDYSSLLYNEDFVNKTMAEKYSPELNGYKTKSDGTRRIIVEFESKSQLDVFLEDTSIQSKFGDFTSFLNDLQGERYAQFLESEQSQFVNALKKSSLEYEIRHTYTSILNGISLVVRDEDVKKYESLPGVKNIIYSENFATPEGEPTINVVDVYDTGIFDTSGIEYKGDGILAAVLDTGFDISHDAFQKMPTVQKVTKSDVASVFNKTAAKSYRNSGNVTYEDVYYNEKVPFAYDYANGDADVFAISNSHGVHVAGIIAGEDDSVNAGDDKAFENGQTFKGVAPNAQLMIGKVFSDTDDGLSEGAETDDILASLSDCVVVGADIINMSLGRSKGFSREEDGDATNEIYDKIYAAGINLVVAASNDGSSSLGSDYGSTGLTSNPDTATVGSPSTYTASLSVASISGQKSPYLQLEDGTAVYYNESSNASGTRGDFMEELLGNKSEGTFNYVVVPGYGKSNNYNANVMTELKKGNCIAVVSRGETSFEEKQQLAYEKGAIACIIYNNVSGKISASLGTGKKIPTCTVTLANGRKFEEKGKGTITLNTSFEAGPFMSDFSSWGPTNDLKIKPEITAHGGEITSAVVGGYSQYSGTSMAAPNMAGAVAIIRQHVEEKFGLTGVALADRVNHLLMSTATIVYDENGLPYSIRKQGAGLGDIGKAMATDAYLSVDGSAKPKLEIGDDPSRTGAYTMQFNVVNHSDKQKTYNLDVIAMTECVSVDNITVEEKAYLLNEAHKTYYVDGKLAKDKKVVVPAGEQVSVRVNLALSSNEKKYLDANFENGMYVEGYITLADSDTDGVNLSLPYLAFYGDWTDAPIFDYSSYEVSDEHYDSSIKEEDKIHAAVYETMAVGSYVKEFEDYYMPLGTYIYSVSSDPDADSGVVSEVDKIAVGNGEYGIYEFYAMYFGTLRGVGEMRINVENAVTGEVYYDETQYNVNKAPGLVELELSPYELGLANNEKVMMTFEADLAYSNGKTKTEKQEYWFYVDYQAPIIFNAEFRYENAGGGKRNVILDLTVYDNHYVQSIQLFTMKSETEVDWLSDYPIPVTNSVRDGESTVSINVTDWMDVFANAEGEFKNKIGVRIDDYALNAAAYFLDISSPAVDDVNIKYLYDENKQTQNASLEGKTVVVRPGQEIDLTEDSGKVLHNGNAVDASFIVDLIGYSSYSCTNPDAHGLDCGFTYNERTGYTYKAGDYYYDEVSGEVKQKTANDLEPTFEPNTLYTSIVAGPVTMNGKNYVQPEAKTFVCPRCGTQESFKFNTRTGKFTMQLFEKNGQDPMVHDAQWVSDNEAVVKVKDGKLYGVSEGTANISVYATSEYSTDVFSFSVNVTGNTDKLFIEDISVSHYYDSANNITRYVNGSGTSVKCGSILDLYPKITPWYVDSIADLVWESSNSDVVEIVSQSFETAKVLCKKEGAATLLLKSKEMGSIGTFTIIVEEEYKLNSYYFHTYNGLGYSEKYLENGVERKLLVIPANLGIINFGIWNSYREGPFYNHKSLDTVIVPEGVTTIGVYSFANTSIRRLFLPSTIENIAYSAFANSEIEEIYWFNASEHSNSGIVYDPDHNTYNLDKINRGIKYVDTDGDGKVDCSDWSDFVVSQNYNCIAKRVTLGNNCFMNCYNLKTFDTKRVTAMYDNAFDSCTSLETVNLSGLRYTGAYVFKNTSSLKQITMNSNTTINSGMFYGSGVEEIEFIGNRVTNNMFENASNLRTITFKKNLSSIGANAFAGCSELDTVIFEGTCRSIANNAFAGCSSITEFILPNGLTSIGSNAFAGCSEMTTLYVDPTANISSIGDGVFDGCTSFKKVAFSEGTTSNYYSLVSSDGYTMLMDKNGTKVIITPPTYVLADSTSYTIPSGVTNIGDYSYYGNESLDGKELVVPEGVTSIGAGAFKNTGITKVYLPESLKKLGVNAFAGCDKLETVIFMCNLQELPNGLFQGCTSLSYVQIPGSVRKIGSGAFENSGIRAISFSETLMEIEINAFANCEKLAEISFAKNSALYLIDSYAFYNCDSLEKVIMPDSVQAVGHFAFANCDALTEVYVSSGIKEIQNIGEFVFSGTLNLSKAVFGDGVVMIGHGMFSTPLGGSNFYYQQNLAEIVLPDSIKYIGSYAFAGNTALTELDLSNIVEIGDGAFCYATSLERVTVTNALKYVGAGAFMFSGIEEMDLSVVQYIGAQAFFSTNIKSSSFTNNMMRNAQVIGSAAFYDCPNIVEVNLPNVLAIYDSAFFAPIFDDEGKNVEGSITKVDLGQSIQVLGGGAFFGSKIKTINLPKTLVEIGLPAFAGCYELEEINVHKDNNSFFIDEKTGALYRTLVNGTYELVSVPNAWGKKALLDENIGNGSYNSEGILNIEQINFEKLPTFEVLDGTSSIGSWAMGYCRQVYKVSIPASVKTVGTYGFYCVGIDYLNGFTEDMEFQRKYIPKYYFNGLTAPAIEADYSEEYLSIMEMYATYTYYAGYGLADVIIPVNAKGFESVIYKLFFGYKEYSVEIIEEGTQKFIDWISALNLDEITLADEEEISEMNMVYFMLSNGQKQFVSQENRDKLNLAIEKINQLKASAGEGATQAVSFYVEDGAGDKAYAERV